MRSYFPLMSSRYTKQSDISRARVWFFQGKRKIMLYTERAHFYHRYKVLYDSFLSFFNFCCFPFLTLFFKRINVACGLWNDHSEGMKRKLSYLFDCLCINLIPSLTPKHMVCHILSSQPRFYDNTWKFHSHVPLIILSSFLSLLSFFP